ncbi:hypothetical protein A2U01_0054878, partial [Trifolium medium]|nr:hypothetical protein [Trifolium medium]
MKSLYETHEDDTRKPPVKELEGDADFDARPDEQVTKEEKSTVDPLPVETRMQFKRPTPDGEFITIQL